MYKRSIEFPQSHYVAMELVLLQHVPPEETLQASLSPCLRFSKHRIPGERSSKSGGRWVEQSTGIQLVTSN